MREGRQSAHVSMAGQEQGSRRAGEERRKRDRRRGTHQHTRGRHSSEDGGLHTDDANGMIEGRREGRREKRKKRGRKEPRVTGRK